VGQATRPAMFSYRNWVPNSVWSEITERIVYITINKLTCDMRIKYIKHAVLPFKCIMLAHNVVCLSTNKIPKVPSTKYLQLH